MPKKFQTFKCTTCRRQIDIAFDPKRPFIEKCNITFGCTGTLKKTGEKDVGALNASYQYGVENWRARGSKTFDNVDIEENKFLQVSACENGEFIIGVAAELVDNTEFFGETGLYDALNLKVIKLSDKSQIFDEYVFKITTESVNPVLCGFDNSEVPESLFFNEEYDVLVFLNGAQLRETTPTLQNRDFVTFLNDASLPKYSIKITKTLPEMSVVTIIVRKKSNSEIANLQFTSNASLQLSKPSCWSNVDSIKCYVDVAGEIKEKIYYLFTLNAAAILGYNVRIQANIQTNDGSILLSNGYRQSQPVSLTSLLNDSDPSLGSNFDSIIGIFSTGNLEIIDRDYLHFFKLSSLRGTDGFLRFSKTDGKYIWEVSDNVIEQSYYPIEINKFISFNGQYETDDRYYKS